MLDLEAMAGALTPETLVERIASRMDPTAFQDGRWTVPRHLADHPQAPLLRVGIEMQQEGRKGTARYRAAYALISAQETAGLSWMDLPAVVFLALEHQKRLGREMQAIIASDWRRRLLAWLGFRVSPWPYYPGLALRWELRRSSERGERFLRALHELRCG